MEFGVRQRGYMSALAAAAKTATTAVSPIRTSHLRHARPALVIAIGAIGLMACFKDPTAVGNQGVESLDASPPVDTADGAQLVAITAIVDNTALAANSPVTFTTTAGAFPSGSATVTAYPNDSGFARTALRAPNDSVLAIVSATAASVTRTTPVLFVPAPPSWITITPTRFALHTSTDGVGASVSLTIAIGRTHGAPSPGTVVHLDTHVVTGSVSGHLSDTSAVVPSTAPLVVNFVLDAPDSGMVWVRAVATHGSSSAPAVADSTQLHVITP